MLRKSLGAIFTAACQLFRNWRALAIVGAIYALLLTALYVFVTTKEATTAQVGTTAGLALIASLLFFSLQAASAGYARAGSFRSFLMRSVKNSWKLLVISLPIAALLPLAFYLLSKAESRFLIDTAKTSAELYGVAGVIQPEAAKVGSNGPAVALNSVRYLLFGAFTPLALIHLWISANQDGLIATFRQFLPLLARAFSAPSLLIYMGGFVVFALLPYLALFGTTTSRNAWVDISLLTIRLAAVFCLTLIGWVVTVGALASGDESARLSFTSEA